MTATVSKDMYTVQSTSVSYQVDQAKVKSRFPDRPPPYPSFTRAVNIAVVGLEGAGRSLLINDVVGNTPSTSAVFKFGPNRYETRLIKLDSDGLDLKIQPFRWPPDVPSVQGIILCYDSHDFDLLREVGATLNALIYANIPIILVATDHADLPLGDHEQGTLNEGAKLAAIYSIPFHVVQSDSVSAIHAVKTLLEIVVEKHDEILVRKRGKSTSSVYRLDALQDTLPDRRASEISADDLAMARARSLNNTPFREPGSCRPSNLGLQSSKGSPSLGWTEVDSDGGFAKPPLDHSVFSGPRSLTWDTLLEKLFAGPALGESDSDFTSTFLLFYRKFSTPRTLFLAFTDRFHALNNSAPAAALMNRVKQIQYCGLLYKWYSTYPQDFAVPRVRDLLLQFMNGIEDSPILIHYVTELSMLLNKIPLEDPDASWGKADTDESRDASPELLVHHGREEFVVLLPSKSFLYDSIDHHHEVLYEQGQDSSQDSFASTDGGREISVGSTTLLMLNDDSIARELTRQEWAMYGQVEPRDFIRHVWMSMSERAKKKPTLIANAINHFNRLSNWVSAMILEKPRAKQRAKVLEKLMNIAWSLRQMNNYNSLMSLLAGINNASTLRLKATRELVRFRTTSERFEDLEALMASERNFASYRAAVKVSGPERVPYLGIHMQDLVAIGDGNKTFTADGLIHWRKFELMMQIIRGIIDGVKAPKIAPDKDFEALFSNFVIVSEEVCLQYFPLTNTKLTGSISAEFGSGTPRRYQHLCG